MREDWVECELDDALIRMSNGSSSKQFNEKVGFPISRIETIWNETIDLNRVKYIKESSQEIIDKYGLLKNDILFSHINSNSHLGKTAIYKNQPKVLIHGINLLLLRPSSLIIADFLLFQLRFLKIQGLFIKVAQQAVNQSSINQRKLKAFEIKLAPLPIQRAIVAKIEELFSDLDNGIANLKKAQEQLKVYRQAVLKKAFEGEFTKEWRKKQTNLPTADELLELIKEERENHYKQQLETWKRDVEEWEKSGKEGRKPRKNRKVKILPLFTEEELSTFSVLPENWTWTKVDEIIEHNTHSIKAGPFGSSLKKSFYVEKGYKVYGQEQVIGGSHKIGDYYVDEKKYKELLSCAVKPKDILISLVGTIGKVLILPNDIENGIINPRLIKISLNNFYKPEFFKYYFESSYLKSLYAHKSHGATMNIITLGIIQELPFPLLSIPEQHQIVLEIESRLSVCDKLEQNIEESLAKAEALRQSILKQAFEGKLLSKEEIQLCKKEKMKVNENKIQLENLNDIYKYKKELKESVGHYLD